MYYLFSVALAAIYAPVAYAQAPTKISHFLSEKRDSITVAVKEATLPRIPTQKAKTLFNPSQKNADFRLISLGGGLTSGFRDDGLYREAQQWAYPNLIARQMSVPFEQPLFSKAKGNGTGYLTKKIDGIKQAYVSNNLARTAQGELEAYRGKALNNFAVPHFSRKMDQSSALHPFAQPFMRRLKSNIADDVKPIKQIDWVSSLDLQSDFFILELGFDDLVQSIQTDGAGISQFSFETLDNSDEMQLINELVRNGKKGVLLNVPDVVSLPFFQQFRWDVLKKLPVSPKVPRSTSTTPVDFDPEKDLLLPGETAEKILSGKLKGPIVLKDIDVLSSDPYDNERLVANPGTFNKFKIENAAKKHNLAVADINALYKRILAGDYQSTDGVKIDPRWPEGNFFSADGIYPTALGQAVIANECILAINAHYGLSIPLIELKNIDSDK